MRRDAYAHADSDSDADCDAYCYTDGDTYGDANCYAKSYPHTQASRNSAPAPVAAKEIVISDR